MRDVIECLSDEDALKQLLLNIECLDELLPWTKKFNLFDVLKIAKAEIRHSNMLSWLLNPNENHGLGDSFVKGILQRLVEYDSVGKYDIFKTLLMDMYSFTVYIEWKNIDILLVSEKEMTLVAIENKIGSSERSNQLNKYHKILSEDYFNYKKMCIFLTPKGEDPSDTENWDVLTYSDIAEVLEAQINRIDLRQDVELIIKNYLDIIRRDIVEDQKLIEICNKINNKHKRALDLIFKHRVDGKTKVGDTIRNVLSILTEENKICYSEENSTGSMFIFHTEGMNSLLHPLESNSSSWGTKYIYHYWFSLEEKRFRVIFELGGWEVLDSEMQKMQKIIDELKPNDQRRSNFRYKRVYTTKWFDIDDSDYFEDDVAKSVRAAVDEILKKEAEIIEKVRKE